MVLSNSLRYARPSLPKRDERYSVTYFWADTPVCPYSIPTQQIIKRLFYNNHINDKSAPFGDADLSFIENLCYQSLKRKPSAFAIIFASQRRRRRNAIRFKVNEMNGYSIGTSIAIDASPERTKVYTKNST